MTSRRTAPYGAWASPLPIELLTKGAVTFGEIGAADGRRWWLEGRAEEAGRQVLVRREADGSLTRLTPEGFNARCRVHEYGGGAILVDGDLVVVSDFATGRLHRVTAPGVLEPLTPDGRAWRFADLSLDRARNVPQRGRARASTCARCPCPPLRPTRQRLEAAELGSELAQHLERDRRIALREAEEVVSRQPHHVELARREDGGRPRGAFEGAKLSEVIAGSKRAARGLPEHPRRSAQDHEERIAASSALEHHVASAVLGERRMPHEIA